MCITPFSCFLRIDCMKTTTHWIRACLSVLLLLVSNGTLAMNITFENQQERDLWRISNDTVMGGVSRSHVGVEKETLRFYGTLSLQNNGGFVSVWRRAAFDEQGDNALWLKARGDGRTYQFRIRLNGADGIAYTTSFTTSATWQWYRFGEGDFVPVWRGRKVLGAPPVAFSAINSVGILLADKQSGDFAIEIAHISQDKVETVDKFQ